MPFLPVQQPRGANPARFGPYLLPQEVAETGRRKTGGKRGRRRRAMLKLLEQQRATQQQPGLSQSYQEALDSANAANEERFQFGMGGQLDLLEAQMALAEQFGAGEETRLDRAYKAASTRGQQNAVSRGLTGTTIPGAIERGFVREREESKTALANRLAQMRAQLQGDFGQRVLDFSERKTDTGPDISQLIALEQGGGQFGGAGVLPQNQGPRVFGNTNGGFGDVRNVVDQPGGRNQPPPNRQTGGFAGPFIPPEFIDNPVKARAMANRQAWMAQQGPQDNVAQNQFGEYADRFQGLLGVGQQGAPADAYWHLRQGRPSYGQTIVPYGQFGPRGPARLDPKTRRPGPANLPQTRIPRFGQTPRFR